MENNSQGRPNQIIVVKNWELRAMFVNFKLIFLDEITSNREMEMNLEFGVTFSSCATATLIRFRKEGEFIHEWNSTLMKTSLKVWSADTYRTFKNGVKKLLSGKSILVRLLMSTTKRNFKGTTSGQEMCTVFTRANFVKISFTVSNYLVIRAIKRKLQGYSRSNCNYFQIFAFLLSSS